MSPSRPNLRARLGFGVGVLCVLVAMDAAYAVPPAVQTTNLHQAAPRAKSPKPPAVPPTERFGLSPAATSAVYVTDAVDHDALLAEDTARQNSPLRVGVNLPLQLDIASASTATLLPGRGTLNDLSILSPGARAMRLSFTDLDLPPGVELWITSTADPAVHEGPYEGRGPAGDGTLWTGVFPGDEVQVEVLSPSGAVASFAGLVDEVAHFYRPWMEPVGDDDLRAGTCHNDVMCFPAWHPLHNATAMVAYSVGSSTFVCGATLLATTSGDETPYLLTASHCINQESVANTVGAYWFFQTVDCNGANETQVISPNATLVWTSGVVDMTLLMLRGALPDGLTWAGWSTTTNLANGTDVACIHHPTGARKKISFGDEIDHPFGDPTNYWGVSWTSGVIEVGSSGGGLYIASTQQLIGVTSHSSQPIDCTNADGPSGFGKFGQAYPSISTLLAAGFDDAFEPNDTCGAAVTLNAGTADNLVVKSLDEDWYKITLPANRKLTVDAIFAHAWGDIDLELYSACGGTLLASSRGKSNNEQLTRIGSFCTAGTYYLRVFLDSDTRNEHSLTVTMSNCADGDGDCNGLINLADYSSRAACATKPGGSAPAGCDMHNFDCDSDVDLRDFAAFQRAYTGP